MTAVKKKTANLLLFRFIPAIVHIVFPFSSIIRMSLRADSDDVIDIARRINRTWRY